jgi:Immunoglobulin-like domain of bacterial spore germination
MDTTQVGDAIRSARSVNVTRTALTSELLLARNVEDNSCSATSGSSSRKERRTEIADMLHNETQVAGPHPRCLMPVAAAATMALLVGAIAWNGGGAASATSVTTSNATRLTTQVALPAYFVGAANRTGDNRLGLYREFVRAALPAGATPAQKAKAAVAVAMKIQPSANIERYVQPWSGTSVRGNALAYQDLAPIWITAPARGQVFAARTPVVATGQSCAFEANTLWQLKKGAAVIKSGYTTASSGCPTRGTWQVRLGVLAAGAYTFRMYEPSMDGRGVVADTSKTFTVK